MSTTKLPDFYSYFQEKEEQERDVREEEADRQRRFQTLADMEGGKGGAVNLAYSHPTIDTAGTGDQK